MVCENKGDFLLPFYSPLVLTQFSEQSRKQGETANHKRIRRLYRAANLTLPRKLKKRLPDSVRQPLPKAVARNGCWSLDFTSDALTDGRKFRTLNVLDDYSRKALGIEIDYSLPAQRVTRLLDRLINCIITSWLAVFSLQISKRGVIFQDYLVIIPQHHVE